MTIPGFLSEWVNKGKRVDTDHFPAHAIFQCVDLVKQYLKEVFGLPFGAFGDAIAYWTHTAPAILTKFNRISTTNVQRGDIVVLKPNHIGISTGRQTSTLAEIAEENGQTGNGQGVGGDAIRTRWIAKSRIAGVLRPKPAPARAIATVKAKVKAITAKKYNVGKPTHGYMNSADAKARRSPRVTVFAGTYYIFNQDSGMINVTKKAGVPGAWINPADAQKPAPKPAPSNTYRIKRNVRGYINSFDAAHRRNPRNIVRPANYYIFNKDSGMINVTSKRGVPGSWINPGDNK